MTGHDAEVDRRAIAEASAALLEGVNASDTERCIAAWAADGVMMPPHHPAVEGSRALREFFSTLFASARVRFTFTSSRIDIAGDTALEYVTYTAVSWSRDAVAPAEDVGKGLHVFKRQLDGAWKLARDIWNSDR